jgi:FG-GAP-like repeat
MKRLSLILLALAGLCAACDSSSQAPSQTGSDAAEPKGKQLMTQYCGACHSLPSPSDLDQKTWRDHILVRMGAYMGIYNDTKRYYDSVPAQWLEPGIGGQRVLAGGIYPKTPLLSRPDWETLRDYIIQNAPIATSPAPGMLPISKELPLFKGRKIEVDPNAQPLVSAVMIDTLSHRMYAAFFQQSVIEMNAQGKTVSQYDGLYGPVYMHHDAAGFTLAEIGSFKGSDHPKGSIRHAPDFKSLKTKKPEPAFDSLMRPLMAKWADLDQDGDLDAVLSEFGYHFGEMAWMERTADQKWLRHTLYPDDGTVSVQVADFTGDGLPDILSLKANADERVDLYTNKGHGQFEAQMLFRFNPTYGCTALEVVDWDRDGKLDFLVANGDNGDYPPIVKPNHGIRLYLNKGAGQFAEAHYWPMDGAYGMRVRDFDRDGDPDLAAVSFYPDYKMRPEEAFIYFENQGNMQFKALTFPDVGIGRWMVMDAGDIDGDGDEDIILGAFDVKSDDCKPETYDFWIQENAGVYLLENMLLPSKIP